MAALPVSTTVSATLPFTHNGQPVRGVAVAPVPSCNHRECHMKCTINAIENLSDLYASLATLVNFVGRISNKEPAKDVTNKDLVKDINKLATMVLRGNGFEPTYQQDFEENFNFSLNKETFITSLMSPESAVKFNGILNEHCKLKRPNGWFTTRLKNDPQAGDKRRIAIKQSIFEAIDWKLVAASLSARQASVTSTSSTSSSSTSAPSALLPTESTVPAKQAQPKESKQ